MIKLDFDGKTLPINRIRFVFKILRLSLEDVKVYKTVRKWKSSEKKPDYGWHVRLWVKETMPIYHLGYVQALMGSDWKRESYNFIRIVNLLARNIKGVMRENWNVLFSKKIIRGRVASVEEFDEEMTKKLREKLCG